MRRSFFAAFGGAVLALMIVGPQLSFGGGTPANKAVASGSTLVAFAPGTGVSLLTATMKTSAPTDLFIQVNLECSILTQLTTGGDHSATSTATGDIRAWVEVDGRIVPINSVSTPGHPAPAAGTEIDKVTFCNRSYSRSITDTENNGDNPDGTDTQSDYISTKSAHSFGWVRLNAGSGTHSIVVKADMTVETAGDAVSEAYVGNRTMMISPEKMANNASV